MSTQSPPNTQSPRMRPPSASASASAEYTKPFARRRAAIWRMEIKHNKTYPSLLVFKNNNMARGSQGFVGQSSRKRVTRLEQPSVLNK